MKLQHHNLLQAGIKNTILSSEMARDNTRQMDAGRSTGIQPTFRTGTSSHTITSVCLQSGGEKDNNTGDKVPSGERSNPTLTVAGAGGLHEQYFLDPQERREMEVDPQPESSEQVCDSRTLQNGGHPLCEGPPKQGRLYVQVRPQGCLSLNLNSPIIQKVSEIQMARESL